MAIGTLSEIVFDCPDPGELAAFYAAILGWEAKRTAPDWATVTGDGPFKLAFQLAPDHKPPVWPDADHPQQLHLDIRVENLEKGTAEVLALGAVKHDHQPGDEDGFVVFLDPAGHPFCLVD
ncbi:glyoxalase [Acrocarpospora corrugata]|uniref:Glyoxalase n=1 Tax=Acrocarpospora corrugata TaxID=35763 RepID=A0A5M3W0I9_9ACTN|nr:VOC family protein [Acrocarpospora corrugata]GES02306.1 glyoxalase [Acrocarpospora corrugata]